MGRGGGNLWGDVVAASLLRRIAGSQRILACFSCTCDVSPKLNAYASASIMVSLRTTAVTGCPGRCRRKGLVC